MHTSVDVIAGVASVGGRWIGEMAVRQQASALAGTSRPSDNFERWT